GRREAHGDSNAAAERQVRAERIRAYFKERAGQKEAVATTRTASGQIIDWIRPASQISAGQKLATAPERAAVTTPPGYEKRLTTFTKAPSVGEHAARTEIQEQPHTRETASTVT